MPNYPDHLSEEGSLVVEVNGIDSWPSHWILLKLLDIIDRKMSLVRQTVFVEPSENSVDLTLIVNTTLQTINLIMVYLQYRQQNRSSFDRNIKYVDATSKSHYNAIPSGFKSLVNTILKYSESTDERRISVKFSSPEMKTNVKISSKSSPALSRRDDSPMVQRGRDQATSGQKAYIQEQLNDVNSMKAASSYLSSRQRNSIEELDMSEAEELIDLLRRR